MKQYYKMLILCITFLASHYFSFAQQDEPYSFEDSLFFSRPELKFVSDLKSLKAEFLDTILNPAGYIIRTNPADYSYKISIALKKKNGFQIFNIDDEGSNIVKISRVNFNNKGNKELLFEYSRQSGISGSSGGYHGWSEYVKGFSIWDLDKIIQLGKLENYFSHTEWYETFDPNEPDTLENEKRTIIDSGSDQSCFHYTFNVGIGTVLFKEASRCNDFDENIQSPISKPKIIRYRLGSSALVKVK